jgi:predicted Zn-dependent peptidase
MGRSSLGTKASVASLTLDDVKSFWKSFGVPGGARIAYVGSLDGAAVKRSARAALGGVDWSAPAEVRAHRAAVDREDADLPRRQARRGAERNPHRSHGSELARSRFLRAVAA